MLCLDNPSWRPTLHEIDCIVGYVPMRTSVERPAFSWGGPLTKVDHPGGSYVTDGSGTRGVQSMGALSIHVDVRVPQCRVRGELELIYLICRVGCQNKVASAFSRAFLHRLHCPPRASLTTRREAGSGQRVVAIAHF